MNAQLARAVEAAYLELDLLDVGAASPGHDTHVVLRRLLDALSAPPADDVREALAAVLDDSLLCWTYNGTHTVFHPTKGADAVLARFEVRPRGTVTDAEVDAAARAMYGGPAFSVGQRARISAALEAAREVRS